MEGMFSFKELEDCTLRATYKMRLGNREIEPGEVIVRFDKIQISGLQELKSYTRASGGFDNRGLVFWETTKEARFGFQQGVFSRSQFAVLNNAKLLTLEPDAGLLLSRNEELETNETGALELKFEPAQNCYVYNKQTGEKINYTRELKTIKTDIPYQDVIVQYQYRYQNLSNNYKIGQQLINGFVEFEGKTRIKDDETGRVQTGVIKIPKLKLMSDLSISLGAQASYAVGNFQAIGVPVGTRGSSYVSEFCLLETDIDSDF